MTTAVFHRSHFEIHRAAEYFTSQELQAQTGQPSDRFTEVVLKELLDNALDAAENAGRPPCIGVTLQHGADCMILTIEDNGRGIPPELVSKILDFNTCTSDKSSYRAPTRGAQGNALKTVIGIAHVESGFVVIESLGIRHEIRPTVTPAGTIQMGHKQTASSVTCGTKVSVHIQIQMQVLDLERWTTGYQTLNPHAQVKIRVIEKDHLPSSIGFSEIQDFYFSDENRPFDKFKPNDPTSIHWYEFADFQRLAYLTGTQRDIGIREFVREFRGLSGTAKLKTVCEGSGGNLAEIAENEVMLRKLFAAMQTESRPIKPEQLGILGDIHLAQTAGVEFNRQWYKRVKGDDPAAPFVFEVFLGLTQSDVSAHLHGINHSVTFEDPYRNAEFEIDGLDVQGVDGAFALCDLDSGYVLVTHLVCPRLAFLDRGKTRLHVPPAMLTAINGAIASAFKVLLKERRQRERNYVRTSRRILESRKESIINMCDAVFEVLPQAIENGTGGGQFPISARSLFYQVRPLIQDYTAKELDYGYFSQTLLPKYQQEHGNIPQLYYDSRGWLYEPHTGQEIQLGTREVESYVFPAHRFNKVLFVEKKGLWPVLRQAQLAERYDMAIIASEGYATTAARTLLARADSDKQYQLFVLHDADPDGYNIARTLQEETRRMPGHSIQVVDLGLTVEASKAMDLPSESFSRKKALPDCLELTELERSWFIGRPVKVGNKTQWTCHRVELNAMSSAQLIDYIEDGLWAAGADTKVLPDESIVRTTIEAMIHEAVAEELDDVIGELLDPADIARTTTTEFLARSGRKAYRPWVNRRLRKNRSLPWDGAAEQFARQLVDRARMEINETLRVSLIARIGRL